MPFRSVFCSARVITLTLATLFQGGVGAAHGSEIAPPAAGFLEYDVIRKGEVIGDLRSDVSRRPDGAIGVTTHIEIQVSVGPIRLYHFTHASTEIWRENRLVSLLSDTDDDGEKHHLQVHEEAAGLALLADGNPAVATGQLAVPSSLWTRAMVDPARPIFDIVDGQIFDAQSRCEAATPPDSPGTHCEITGELERSLHFAPEGQLDGVSFLADDGSRIVYRKH